MNTFLIGLYSLLPNIITFIHAKDWDPFEGCDIATSEGLSACKIADPPFTMDMSTAVANMFAKWSAEFSLFMLKIGTVDVFGQSDTGEWNYPGIGAFIEFFKYFSWLMLGLGIILAVAETGVAYMNGQGNSGTTVINICKAIIFVMCFTKIAIYLFGTAIDLSNAVAAAIAGAGNSAEVPSINVVKVLFDVETGALLIKVAFVLIYVILYFFFVLGLGKRYVNFLLLLSEGCLIPLNLARGYAGQFQSYIQKVLLFFVGVFANVTFFNIGAQMIGSIGAGTAYDEGLGTLIIGIAFMTGANKVFSQLGTVGSGGDIGMAMHAGEHALRMVKTVGSAFVTGGGSLAVEGASAAANVASSAVK